MNIPASLSDLQMILDNYGIMNASYSGSAEVLADNYYLTQSDWASVTSSVHRNYYIWQKDDQNTSDWSSLYRVVYYSNVVLDELHRMDYPSSQSSLADNIKGSALFFRAFSFYSVAQLFAPAYDSITAPQSLGISLRLNADIEQRSVRASLQQTYQQVINDLKLAAWILPSSQYYINRPWKAAAYAALARTYLTVMDYNKALYYADSALQLNSTLIDFNSLSTTAAIPIPRFSAEVIFPAVSLAVQPLNPSRAKVDSVLFNQYNTNDLRRSIFFKSNGNNIWSPKASYDGSTSGVVFSGLTTSELYLIKAECLARLGQVSLAMNTLNDLLQKRWKTNTFTPLGAATVSDALNKILAERRKELVFRGLRWTDLRRLNKDFTRSAILFRKLGTDTYTLLPNSNAYTMLIPASVIDLTGMPQNP